MFVGCMLPSMAVTASLEPVIGSWQKTNRTTHQRLVLKMSSQLVGHYQSGELYGHSIPCLAVISGKMNGWQISYK